MPTYEYRCESCGHNFDAFQKMSDPVLDKCPKCGGKVKRLISSGAGFIFKGSGFYATDYRKNSAKKPEPSAPTQCPMAKEGCGGCQHKPEQKDK